MRKVTAREKIFLGIGALAVICIIAYLALTLQDNKPGQKSSMEEMRERLIMMKKLESMASMMGDLEKRMRTQSGYGEMSFERGIADSTIIRYVAQAAANAGIGELEQLDPKPDTSKKSQTESKTEQVILGSVIDRIYLVQVTNEMENKANSSENTGNTKPASNPDPNPTGNSNVNAENNPVKSSATSDEAKNDEISVEATESVEQKNEIFPSVPEDIPDEVRKALAKTVEARHGKTIAVDDISRIVGDAGVNDEKERERITSSLKSYNDRVKEAKSGLLQLFNKLEITQDAKKNPKVDRFTVKVVFKGQLDQLVRFLYNLQDSAKWLKVDSMNITISDRKQTLLTVEISMTAAVLYD